MQTIKCDNDKCPIDCASGAKFIPKHAETVELMANVVARPFRFIFILIKCPLRIAYREIRGKTGRIGKTDGER